MAWATPSSFSVGEVVTATKMNEIRDNLRYLKGLDGAIDLSDALQLGANEVRFGASNYGRILTGPSNRGVMLRDLGSGSSAYGMFWSTTGLAGSSVTVIPDGAGDVSKLLTFLQMTVAEDGTAPSTSVVQGQVVPGGSPINLFTNGANTVVLTVNAAGDVVVGRTGGTKTYTVGLWLIWT